MPSDFPDKPSTKTLNRDGITLCYRVIGAGPALVMIPSLGRAGEDFDVLLPYLVASGLRVILPEPRGIAGSDPLPKGATLHDMAADIAAILEHEGVGRAIIAGHAAGNWVARVLAADRPDLIRGVALLAAIVTQTVPPAIQARISASFDPTLPDEARFDALKEVYFAPGHDASVWLDGWWPDAAVAQRQAARNTPDQTWVRVADRHPTLYIAAADDVISPPPDLRTLRAAIGPKASCDVVANAGHALLPEQPGRVAQSLLAWIDQIP